MFIIYLNAQVFTSGQTPLNTIAKDKLEQKCISYPITIAVIGDPHPKASVTYKSYYDDLVPILRDIRKYNPDLIICCGDMTDGGSVEYFNDFADIINYWMDTTSIPFFCLPGNHDFDRSLFNDYYNIIGEELNYCFDVGHTRFVLLNNVQQPGDNAWTVDFRISDEAITDAIKWIVNMPLNGFVFTHVPLYESSFASCGIFSECSDQYTIGPESGYPALHLLNKTYNVRSLFSGHLHKFAKGNYDGVDYFITGSAGGNVDCDPKGEINHWMLVTVDEMANISAEVKWEDGTTDYYSLTTPFITGTTFTKEQITENTKKIYYASNSITAGNNYNIVDNATGTGDIKFVAANIIELTTGFTVERGGRFTARIVPELPCGSTKSATVAQTGSLQGITNYSQDVLEEMVNVYPNPGKGYYYIKGLEVNSNALIIVKNALGNTVYTEKISVFSDASIDISNQPDGIYFITINLANSIINKRIIKQ
ncbi:MAG: metallophosphoesterase [Bacteroidales bacterium]|nr:metallophosphoesterase [Bacteroidales bacterium]